MPLPVLFQIIVYSMNCGIGHWIVAQSPKWRLEFVEYNNYCTSWQAEIRVHIWLGVGSQSAPVYWQLECVCLQRKSLSAAEGLFLAAITIIALKSTRADDKFALLCKDVTTLAEHNLVNAPVLAVTAAAFTGTIMKMETPLLNSMKNWVELDKIVPLWSDNFF